MEAQGRCYCGAVRYKTSGDPILQVQCHCRECQYVSGGSPNVTMGRPEAGFSYTQGKPQQGRSQDLPNPVTRECRPVLPARAPDLPGVVLLRVGTLGEPSAFSPQMAIFLADKQPFPRVPEG